MSPDLDARVWAKKLSPYRSPSNARGVFEIGVTLLPLAAMWALMVALVHWGYFYLALLLAIPAGAFLVRIFIIQHDCGHGSFFRHRWANDWTGRIFGALTMTPYDFWRRSHAIHHAASGNLDRRGIGDIDTLTTEEYRARSAWGRFCYRVYRNPLVLFVIGPAYQFIIHFRLPMGMMKDRGWSPWASTMGTNIAIACLILLTVWLFGLQTLLLVNLPIILIAASIGVWLFYVQHQFEHTIWDEELEWNWHDAAMHGSSHYDLPSPLRWVTGNIGLHHIHHLSSRIPYYRLTKVIEDFPELRDVNRLTLWDSFVCVGLVLWDNSQRRLITFREAHQAG